MSNHDKCMKCGKLNYKGGWANDVKIKGHHMKLCDKCMRDFVEESAVGYLLRKMDPEFYGSLFGMVQLAARDNCDED